MVSVFIYGCILAMYCLLTARLVVHIRGQDVARGVEISPPLLSDSGRTAGETLLEGLATCIGIILMQFVAFGVYASNSRDPLSPPLALLEVLAALVWTWRLYRLNR